MTDIGIFGLGLMGSALAARLLAAGWPVVGHDPDPARQAALADLGGRPLSADGVWSAAGTVILSVFDTTQVEAVLSTAPDACQACVIIVSTCDPDRIAALPGQCPPGIHLVEAPISGTSREVAAGGAVFLVGGDAEAVATAAPVLGLLGRAWHPMGALGNGSRAKLAINLILGLNRAALAEGLVFGRLIGLDPTRLLAVAQDSAAASAVMATKGPLMVAEDFRPQGRVAQSAKDFDLILRIAATFGQNLPGAETYLSLMQDCMAAGEGDLDNSAVIRAIARKGQPSAGPILEGFL